jgi:hypothetical protein
LCRHSIVESSPTAALIKRSTSTRLLTSTSSAWLARRRYPRTSSWRQSWHSIQKAAVSLAKAKVSLQGESRGGAGSPIPSPGDPLLSGNDTLRTAPRDQGKRPRPEQDPLARSLSDRNSRVIEWQLLRLDKARREGRLFLVRGSATSVFLGALPGENGAPLEWAQRQ